MGKKYDEIEKSIAAAASTLPIAGAVVKVFGMLALEGLREYSRFVDTQELQVFLRVHDYNYSSAEFSSADLYRVSVNHCERLTRKLAGDGAQS